MYIHNINATQSARQLLFFFFLYCHIIFAHEEMNIKSIKDHRIVIQNNRKYQKMMHV